MNEQRANLKNNCIIALLLIVAFLLIAPLFVYGGESNGESGNGEAVAADAGESAGESSEDAAAQQGGAQGTQPPAPMGSMPITERLNIYASVLLLPLCILSIILWFFWAYGVAVEKKNNVWLKIYKVLRKIHIPVGAAAVILGLYHTIVASIRHGFSINWGMVAMIFYLLGVVCFFLRKPLKKRWIVLHRFTTLIATICMLIHCTPYLAVYGILFSGGLF